MDGKIERFSNSLCCTSKAVLNSSVLVTFMISSVKLVSLIVISKALINVSHNQRCQAPRPKSEHDNLEDNPRKERAGETHVISKLDAHSVTHLTVQRKLSILEEFSPNVSFRNLRSTSSPSCSTLNRLLRN